MTEEVPKHIQDELKNLLIENLALRAKTKTYESFLEHTPATDPTRLSMGLLIAMALHIRPDLFELTGEERQTEIRRLMVVIVRMLEEMTGDKNWSKEKNDWYEAFYHDPGRRH